MSRLSEPAVDGELAERAPRADAGDRATSLTGGPDVTRTAQLLRDHRGDPSAILHELHTRFGNAFVQGVFAQLRQGVALPKSSPPAPTFTATPDRTALQTKITTAGTKETRELDTTLGHELSSLDHVFAAELGRIDGQADAQERAVTATAATGNDALGSEITANDRANTRTVTAETARQAGDAAKQKAKLHDTADGERGWHQATHDQIMTEDVDPHVATNVGAVKATAASQPAAARAFGAAKATEVRGNWIQAAQARSIGDDEADAIAAEGAAATRRIEAEGAKLGPVADARTHAAIEDLTREEGRQGARIDSQAAKASGEMKQLAAKAHGQMAAERAQFAGKAKAAGAATHDTIEAERTAAKARATELETETAAKMREIHTREQASVETKVKKLLGELAATSDKDLARAEPHIAKELSTLDGIDHAADAAMHRRAAGAENALVDEDQVHAAAIRAAGEQARTAIGGFREDAKQRIADVETPADRGISVAAEHGRDQIASVGADASKDLVSFSEQRQSTDAQAAHKDLAAFDRSAASEASKLTSMAFGVNGKIADEWATDALPEVRAALDKGDGVAGMRSILALPASAQGAAIDKLTDAQFEALLTRVPDGNREELGALVTNTHGAQRKLKLWGVYHKAHAMHDAKNDGAKADAESQRRHAARVNAATTTGAEVDDEIAFMQSHATATGKPFNEADVTELIDRKDTEHRMEMAYNVNFTNDQKLRGDGTHVHWKKDELEAFDNTLKRMPEEHLAGNAGLTEIHRQEIVYWGDPANNVQIGGISTGTQVLIPDQATDTRPSGQERELAPNTIPTQVSWMEWLMTHELGHNVSHKYSDVYAKYRTANGWDAYPKDTDKLTDAEKRTLDAARNKPSGERAHVNKDGKTYQIDQQVPDGYISFTQGALPDSSDSQPGVIGGNDPWAYARTRDFESFAEHYDRAMHVPEKVYMDMIQTPHKTTEDARAAFNAAATPDDKKTAKAKLDIAVRAEAARKESFTLMRDQVFGTAKAQQAAEARLKARGVDTTEFTKEAAHASTPDQIGVIEARFK